MDWLPIETAPKDGSMFIAWDSRLHYPIFDMMVRDGTLIARASRWSGYASHWQPLPPPPEQNK